MNSRSVQSESTTFLFVSIAQFRITRSFAVTQSEIAQCDPIESKLDPTRRYWILRWKIPMRSCQMLEMIGTSGFLSDSRLLHRFPIFDNFQLDRWNSTILPIEFKWDWTVGAFVLRNESICTMLMIDYSPNYLSFQTLRAHIFWKSYF